MPTTLRRSLSLRYRTLFPARDGWRPLLFFMLENLLEARAQSSYPTSLRWPDEDVNIYLAHLLAKHVTSPTPAAIQAGNTPLLEPPACEEQSRWSQREHYRLNGDHRLLCLGLYGRGDLLRRRQPQFGSSPAATWQRDLVAGENCYHCALALAERERPGRPGLVTVLGKLVEGFADYVGVLQAVARYRLGLGARLSHAALRELVADTGWDGNATTESNEAKTRTEPLMKPHDPAAMDALLDLLTAYRRRPSQKRWRELARAARGLGLAPAQLLSENRS